MKALISLLLLSFALPTFAEVPAMAKNTKPIAKGDSVPNPTLRSMDGENITLSAVRNGEPTVLVFYRGGWCPYCTRHLSELQTVLPQLTQEGWKLVAVSPDKPEMLAATSKDKDLGYVLVSDSKMEAAKAFGLAFQLDAPTLKKYDEYGIDLLAATGESHKQLPVPAVILIDAEGTATFVHHDPNYEQRLEAAKLMDALTEEP